MLNILAVMQLLGKKRKKVQKKEEKETRKGYLKKKKKQLKRAGVLLVPKNTEDGVTHGVNFAWCVGLKEANLLP